MNKHYEVSNGNAINSQSFPLFSLLAFGLFNPQTVFSQSEMLGIITYTPPKGMTKTPKKNVVGCSEFNQSTGEFCIITLYGATPESDDPKSDHRFDSDRRLQSF